MLGILLVGIAQFFAEIGTSIGKYEVAHKKESLYAMGFLSSVWASLFFFSIALVRNNWVFALESLPYFIPYIILEIILIFVSLHAVIAADRSTFSFLRTLTVPLLLVTDLSLGYSITPIQIFGIGIMLTAFMFLFFNHGLSRRGKLLSVSSALIAVATLTLYKIMITNYNSVEAQAGITHCILLIVIIAAAKVHRNENVFRHFFSPLYLTQSIVAGFSTLFLSYAYALAPASIISAAKRGFEILAAMLAGQTFFREKHILVKVIAFILIVAGVGLTVV